MSEIQHSKGKIYYSMGEVSEMFDVNPSLIRFWEQKFDVLRPHKNKKGNRMFTPEDVDNLKLIYHLVKEKGMTLAGANKRIKENREGIVRDMEVVDRLLAIKSILMEVREELKTAGDDIICEDPTQGAEQYSEDSVISFIAEVASGETGTTCGRERAGEVAEEKHVKNRGGGSSSTGSSVTGSSATASSVEPHDSWQHERLAADELMELNAEEEWVDEELDVIDELDADINEIISTTDMSPKEADLILESDQELPINQTYPLNGKNEEVEEPVRREAREQTLF